MGSFYDVVSEAGQIAVTEIVGQDDDEIGPSLGKADRNAEEGQDESE